MTRPTFSASFFVVLAVVIVGFLSLFLPALAAFPHFLTLLVIFLGIGNLL